MSYLKNLILSSSSFICSHFIANFSSVISSSIFETSGLLNVDKSIKCQKMRKSHKKSIFEMFSPSIFLRNFGRSSHNFYRVVAPSIVYISVTLFETRSAWDVRRRRSKNRGVGIAIESSMTRKF